MGKVKQATQSVGKMQSPKNEEMVLTPGGWRPKSQVHFLEKGHHIDGKDGHLKIIETATGREIKDLGPVSTKKRVKKAQPGKKDIEPDLPDIAWIENSQWNNDNGQPIVYFSTNWVVPPPPASKNHQTIFLFNGMENEAETYILQPVLQWGKSYAGGGNYWSIANWYVNGQGGTAITPAKGLIKVKEGDVLRGVMVMAANLGGQFSYTSSFDGYPNSDIVVNNIDEMTWAYETLEAYGSDSAKPVPNCSDYPNTLLTSFYNIEILVGPNQDSGTEATINWTPVTNFRDCGQQCLIVSNDSPGGSVYLYYKAINYEVAFQANTSNLWTMGTDNHGDWRLGMMRGTSPSIAALPGGGYVIAFQANTGNLWTIGDDNHGDWKLGMMKGTSPCIAVLADGSYVVAFQANTGNLWTIGADNRGEDWQLGMMAGTSPSITALPEGGYEIAFQANTSNLWLVGKHYKGDMQLGMMPGTSPSIATLSNGDFEVAFQANTSNLWIVGSDYKGDTKYGMMPGTSPSITGLSGGGYEVAFQANTSNLWTVGADNHGDWGLGMMKGTSPSITAQSDDGYEVAFQANTSNLWTVGVDNRGDWKLGMMNGTNPCIASQSYIGGHYFDDDGDDIDDDGGDGGDE